MDPHCPYCAEREKQNRQYNVQPPLGPCSLHVGPARVPAVVIDGGEHYPVTQDIGRGDDECFECPEAWPCAAAQGAAAD